jgi:NADPH-dependent curcumin reductase CurA
VPRQIVLASRPLDHAPSAFINLLRGHNTGKMVVRL